jgi:acetoin utilization protein AcuB
MERPALMVKAWMHAPVHTVKPHDSIEHARELCERHRINQLPVVAQGRLVGIITDRDLRDAFPSLLDQVEHPQQARQDTLRVMVEEAMTPNVITVTPDDDIERAATILKRERLGALPVVHDGTLVGILTRTDVMSALVGLATYQRTLT